MRLLFTCTLLLCVTGTLSACGGGSTATTTTTTTADVNKRATPNAQRPSTHAPEATPPAATLPAPAPPPVASSHGGGGDATPTPADTAAGQGKSSVEKAVLDARIAAALAKAKRPKAGAADKRAAAQAYLERANVYWSAGDPSLYKYALADFKSVLVYDPSNAEAATKRDEIVRIYRAMKRPVPKLSNEQ